MDVMKYLVAKGADVNVSCFTRVHLQSFRNSKRNSDHFKFCLNCNDLSVVPLIGGLIQR